MVGKIMTLCKQQILGYGIIVAFVFSCSVGHAEDITVAGFDRVYKAEGFYEYNKDGVPILGLVSARVSNDRVKFTMCNNTTMEVDPKQLKSSGAKCPGTTKDPGPWTWASKSIQPVVKVASGTTTAMVNFQGKDIDLSGLPGSYKDWLSKAKAGDWVGYAFTEDGKKSLAIVQ